MEKLYRLKDIVAESGSTKSMLYITNVFSKLIHGGINHTVSYKKKQKQQFKYIVEPIFKLGVDVVQIKNRNYYTESGRQIALEYLRNWKTYVKRKRIH